METRQERAVRYFKEGYNCAQAVFTAYADLYGIDKETAFRLSASFGGGLGRMREVCGTVSGMSMVAGLATGAVEGRDTAGKQHNYEVVQQMAAAFKEKSGSIVCKELLGLDPASNTFIAKPDERNSDYYKKRPCVRLVRDAAQIIEEILLKD